MTKFEQFLRDFKGRRVAVVGVGVSNRPLIRLLGQAGASLIICDKNPNPDLTDLLPADQLASCTLRTGPGYLEDLRADVIFRTPGLRPDHPCLLKAVREGAALTSEMECFFDLCPCPIIAVTGSDGKTTTTTLIAKMLEHAGHTCHLGGNIGAPLLAKTLDIRPGDFAVVELSSFQLFTMTQSPSTAVITNISPNHLDVHKDMEEYVRAKENIFLHQQPGDRLILNAADGYAPRFAAQAVGEVSYFSGHGPLPKGFFRNGDQVFYRDGREETLLLHRSELLLPGDHNVENLMAAASAVLPYVSFDDMRAVAASFPGVAHRIELIRELDRVRYYNDSIASSPTRVIAGLRSFDQQVLLIAGGYDKHVPFDALGDEICNHVKALFLTGDTADKIEAAVRSAMAKGKKGPPIYRCADLGEAVLSARNAAKPGDVVLLSPAGPAFDRYKNFEVRGNAFRALVAELPGADQEESE